METESQNFINLGIVLNDKSEVLMIKRKKPEVGKDNRVLLWAFPGGKQKNNENRIECVRREVLGETGYEVIPIREISIRFPPDLPVIIVYHLCKLNKPTQISPPSQPDEVEEIRWVKPEEIKNLITTSLDPSVAQELKIA